MIPIFVMHVYTLIPKLQPNICAQSEFASDIVIRGLRRLHALPWSDLKVWYGSSMICQVHPLFR